MALTPRQRLWGHKAWGCVERGRAGSIFKTTMQAVSRSPPLHGVVHLDHDFSLCGKWKMKPPGELDLVYTTSLSSPISRPYFPKQTMQKGETCLLSHCTCR